MVQKSTFELVRENYKQAEAEKFKEVEKERKALIDTEDVQSEPEPPPREKKGSKPLKKQKEGKTSQLKENLRNLVKQTQANEIINREDRENNLDPKPKC